jgi:chloride channel 3/4/5
MIAAITLKLLDPFGTGKLVLFQVTYHRVSLHADCSTFETNRPLTTGLARLRIGRICTSGCIRGMTCRSPAGLLSDDVQGVYGAYFSKFNFQWSRHVRNGTWLKTHPVAEVILVRGPSSCNFLSQHLLPRSRL